jgi:hypothetical protein
MKVFRSIQICGPEVDFRQLPPNADATEFIGMLSAFMGLLDPGDEVIVFEPFFDQYIYRHIAPIAPSLS